MMQVGMMVIYAMRPGEAGWQLIESQDFLSTFPAELHFVDPKEGLMMMWRGRERAGMVLNKRAVMYEWVCANAIPKKDSSSIQ